PDCGGNADLSIQLVELRLTTVSSSTVGRDQRRRPRHVTCVRTAPADRDRAESRQGADASRTANTARRVGHAEGRLLAGLLGCAAFSGRLPYIIPPMSPMPPMPPAMPAPAFSGGSATIASVMRMRFAMGAAFCRAGRGTIVGSMIPALTRS